MIVINYDLQCIVAVINHKYVRVNVGSPRIKKETNKNNTTWSIHLQSNANEARNKNK